MGPNLWRLKYSLMGYIYKEIQKEYGRQIQEPTMLSFSTVEILDSEGNGTADNNGVLFGNTIV
jgi:hypothetical protein